MDNSSSIFEQLFREDYSRLYAYAFSILRDDDDSADAVNEAFLDAWRHREGIAPEKLSGYVFICLRNKCLSRVRQRQPQTTPLPAETLQRLAAETDDDWREREERIGRIEAAIAQMPERTRYVLRQCYYEHHTYREVAHELGITTDGVKKHITTAMRRLRDIFNIDKHKT